MNTITVLIPAYNEASSIGVTIEAILNQTRQADQIIVIPNGCTDNTADIARQYPVTVMELPKLEHRKSEALNRAWLAYGTYSDYIITMDADTTFPETALEQWEVEMGMNPIVGGSTAKFTISNAQGLIPRLQKAEYSANIQTSLNKGYTHVLAGAGTIFRNKYLHQIVTDTLREGPWSYDSEVEDYELTYRLREAGYKTIVSTQVRGYTDGMKNLKSLWGQRMKWQAGTVDDLLSFGLNKLTFKDWVQQSLGMLNVFTKLLLIVVLVGYSLIGQLEFLWYWWLVPILFIALEFKKSRRIPHRDWKDTFIALSYLPNELYMWVRTGWYIKSWLSVTLTKITKVKKDRWEYQYLAEGV